MTTERTAPDRSREPSGPVRRRRPRPASRPARPVAPPAADGPTTIASALSTAIMVVTGLAVLFGSYLFVFSGLAANRAQDVMYRDLQVALAQATAPVSGVVPDGTPLGVVEIPSLGVEQVFVEGSASEQTMTGPGLRHDSVLPGQAGASVLVGRRAAFGGAFVDLDQLRVGDPIKVTTGQGVATYVVDLVRRTDDPASTVEQVASRLTLVTSDPAYAPSRTLTVSAHLDGDALPASTGTATVLDDLPGHGSSGRGVALLLWSQLLLLVVGAFTWAALRLRIGQALWIGGVPVLLAVLWHVFENLAALLSNTL